MQRTTQPLPLATLALVLASARMASAAEPIEASKALYLRYCASCHGPGGKGDGVASSFFRPKPADLTQLTKKNGGTFPFERTMQVIDGRDTPRAHGDPIMPVWGEIFQAQSGWSINHRAEVQGKIMLITEYLRSIQEK